MAWNKPNFGTGASFNFKFDRQEDEDARGETPEAGGFFFSIRAPLAAQASSLALSSAHMKNWKKKKKKAPVSLSEWIFLTPRVRVAHHSFKSLQRTSKKFSSRKDGKFELVLSLSYSVHKYDAYRNCLTVCEPHMHRPHDNSSSSLCGSVVKQWRRSIPRGDNFFVPCSRRGEWTSFSSSFQFFIYLFWISLNS